MGKGRGDVKGENYFSGFASLVFFLRGWGGVFNNRRRTSSGFKFGSSSSRGFFSVGIGKPSALPLWEISDKESLVAWVRRYLWHYEGVCAGNGPEESPDNPATEIVDNIFKALCLNVTRRKIKTTHLPDPSSYFHIGKNHQQEY